MDLAQYYKKADPVLGVAKVLFLRLFDLYEAKPISKIAKTTSGGTPNRGNAEYYGGNIAWLKSGELNDSFIIESEEFITEEGLKNSSAKLFESGTLLVAMYGATAGKTGILRIDASTNQAVCALFPIEKIERDYLYWFLRQHRIDFILQSKGGAQPNISQKVIKETLIPVPPLGIQRKVIDFLYDVHQKGVVDRKLEFLDPNTIEQIDQFFNTRRTNEILNIKFQTQKQLISELKQAILQEAIQGKLTEAWRKQHPGVEPAGELLKRIKAEKAQLIKEKKIKKEKPLPPITQDEIPFELPEGWVWCRFKDICNFNIGKTPASKQADYWSKGKYNWLSISDMNNLGYIERTTKKITQKAVDDVFKNQLIIPENTLLMSFKLTVGKVSINKVPLYHNEAIISIFPYHGILQKFLFNLITPITELSISKKVLMGQTFNSKSLATMLIPLPPHSEQKAIVKKVETLMQKCNALEQEITQSEQHANMLMQAVLKEAFEGKKKIED